MDWEADGWKSSFFYYTKYFHSSGEGEYRENKRENGGVGKKDKSKGQK